MILQQTYEKIAEYTSQVFQLYAKRMFISSVLSLLQNKHVRISNKDFPQQLPEHPTNSLRSFTEMDEQKSLQNQEFKKKTVKSIVFKESDVSEDRGRCEIELSQLFYLDRVMMVRGTGDSLDLRVVIYSQMGLMKGLEFHRIKGNNINTEKCLFEIGCPRMGQSQERRPLVFGDIIVMRNVWSGRYLAVDPNQLAQKSFGCRVTVQENIDDQCLFRIGSAEQKGAYSFVFTNSPIRLVLHKNPFFKLLIHPQHRMSLQQAHYHELVANSSSQDLQLLKLKPNFSSPNSLSSALQLNSSQFYYLSSPTSQYLASTPIRSLTSVKQKSFNLLIENGMKFNFTVDDIPCRGCHQAVWMQKATSPFQPNAVWEIGKLGLLEHLGLGDGDQVVLVNVFTHQYLTWSRSNRKVKLTVEPAEAKVFKVEWESIEEGCKLKIEQSSITPKAKDQKINWAQLANEQLAYYNVVPIQQQVMNDLKLLSDIQSELVGLYRRITIWGIIKDEKNQTCYTFEKSLDQEYLLKVEVKRYEECLTLISNFLKKDYSAQRKMGLAQSKLRQTQILELLICFCRLFVSKMENIKVKDKQIVQTAFGLAKKHLQPALLLTMDVLYKLIIENQANSDVVMQAASFFNTLLVSYSQKAGGLLQQAIRNLSILHTSYNQGDELFQWIKLIQIPTIHNVATQTKYMQILAEVMVDPSDRGIPNYQNKCYQLMFVQSRFKAKNPLAYASLETGSPEIYFYYPNPGGIEEIKSAYSKRSKDSHCCLDLGQLIKLSKTKEGRHAANYLNYFTTIFKLLRNMCKDRNKKLTKIVQGLGFTREFIMEIVRSDDIDSKNTMPFLSLYMEMYMDQDPFIPFSKVQKKCYLLDSFGLCDMQTKTCIIFKQFSQTVDIEKFTKECEEHILPFVQSYLSKVSKRVCSKPIQDPQQYFLLISLIRFIYCGLNFGYLTIDYLRETLSQLITSVSSIIALNSNTELFNEYFQKLLHEILLLIDLSNSVFLNLSLVQMLVQYYWSGIQAGEQFNRESIKTKAKNMLIGYLTKQGGRWKAPEGKIRKLLSIEAKSSTVIKPRKEKSIYPTEFIERPAILTTSDFNGENACARLEKDINQFLMRVITMCSVEQVGETLQKAVNLLSRKSRMHLELSNLLVNIELIVDDEDQRIYQELRGGQAAQVLNIIKLETQVDRLTDEYAQASKQKVRLEIILQINSLLKKLIKKLQNYRRQGRQSYRKAQNIICKLNVYHILRTLIHKCTTKPEFKDLTCTVHRFLVSFVRNNQTNQLLVAKDFALLAQAFESPHLPAVLELVFDQVENKIQAFKILLQAGNVNTNSKSLVYESVYRLLLKLKNAKLEQICFDYIIHQPQNHSCLSPTVKPQDGWLFRVLCLLLKRTPSRSPSLHPLYPRKPLQSLLVESTYLVKPIYLELYYCLYFLSQTTVQQTAYTLSHLIVSQLNKVNQNLDGIASDKVLLSITEQEDDYSLEMTRRSNLIKEARRSVESVKAEEVMPEEFERRRKRKEQGNTLEEQAQYWQYMCSPDGAQYSVMGFLKEALENGRVGIPPDMKVSLEKIRRTMRSLLEKSGIHEYIGIIDELDYVLILMNIGNQETVGNSKDYLKNFFTNLSQAIQKSGVSMQELITIFKIDTKDMMEYLKGTYDGTDRMETPFRDVINSFKVLRQRIGYQREISLNNFRKFYSLFRQNREHVVMSFIQKIQETLEQKKNAALNGIFADMKGKVEPESQNSGEPIGQSPSFQTSSINSVLCYKGSHQLKENIFQNYLSAVNKCLLEDLPTFKKQILLQQFSQIVSVNPNRFEHFCGIYKVAHQDPLVIEMFLTILKRGCIGRIEKGVTEIIVSDLVNRQHGMLIEVVNLVFGAGKEYFEELIGQLKQFIERFFQRIRDALTQNVFRPTKIEQAQQDLRRVLILAKTLYLLKQTQPICSLVHTLNNSIIDLLIFLTQNGRPKQCQFVNPSLKLCFQHVFLSPICLPLFTSKLPMRQFMYKLKSFFKLLSFYDMESTHKQLFSDIFQVIITLSRGDDPFFNEILSSLDYSFYIEFLEEMYFGVFMREGKETGNVVGDGDGEAGQGMFNLSQQYLFEVVCKIMILIEIAVVKAEKEEFKELLSVENRMVLDKFTQIKNHRENQPRVLTESKTERKWCEMMEFYQKFKGKIKIIEDCQPREFYFKVPSLCSYRNDSITSTITNIILQNEGQYLYTQLYSISRILYSELCSYQTYQKYLPSAIFKYRAQIQTGMFFIMILVNLFVGHTLIRESAVDWKMDLARLFIILQLLPQLLLAWFSIRTNLNIIKFTKPTITTRIGMFLDAKNLSIVIQVIAIFFMPIFPLSCLLMSMQMPAVREIVMPSYMCLTSVLKALFYSLILLLQYTLYLSNSISPSTLSTPTATTSRPYQIFGPMISEYLRVVLNREAISRDDMFYSTINYIPIKYVLDVLLALAISYHLMSAIEYGLKSRYQQRANRRCLICLKEEMKDGKDIRKHVVDQSHHVWDYLNFFVYVQTKEQSVGVQATIKKWIKDRNWNFIKIR